MAAVLGHGSPWSRPGGAVFRAAKSGRSLQRATRGRACGCACVRIAGPGSSALLQSVSMTRRSRAPREARGGD